LAGQNTVKEEKFTKLKASYLKLRDEHVQLLREEGDVRKQLTSLQVVVTQEDTSKKVMYQLTILHCIKSHVSFVEGVGGSNQITSTRIRKCSQENGNLFIILLMVY